MENCGNKVVVQAVVTRKFGMEGRGQHVVVAHQNGFALQ